MNKDSPSSKNATFWNELCGSRRAKEMGIIDTSLISLQKFDDWYFKCYPYLSDHIPFDLLKGKDVLEVGLGYGTLSQKIVESGANYIGLDIASEPVSIVNQPIIQQSLNGRAIQGSILEPPLTPNSFDFLIAIGSLHHTGDLKEAINQCHLLLRNGGQLIFMVYNAFSYRRWIRSPITTLIYYFREKKGMRGVVGGSSDSDRAAYDKNLKGVCAPHTDWISIRSLMQYCSCFSSLTFSVENIDRDSMFIFCTRKFLLKTSLPSKLGLDLYVRAIK